MKNALRPQVHRGKIRLLLVGVFILALVAAIIIPVWMSRTLMMQGTMPDTVARLASAQPGTKVKVVCEITTRLSPTLIEGIVLEASGGESYRRSEQSVRIQINPGQEIIMGGQQDLRKDTIIQVQGSLDQEKVIQSDQVVILTGYVTVKRK